MVYVCRVLPVSFCPSTSSAPRARAGAMLLKIISRIAGKKKTKTQNIRAGARCEPCAPYCRSPLNGIERGHPQRHSQAMASCRKRGVHDENSLRLVDCADLPTKKGEINPNSPAIFLSWTTLSRPKLVIRVATLARYGRPSGSPGTSSSTIKRMPFAHAAGFDDVRTDRRALQSHET